VTANGLLNFRADRCPVGSPFSGLQLGIQIVDAMHIRVWLRDVDLGVVETLPAVDDDCFELSAARRARRTHEARPRERVGTVGAPSPASPTLTERPKQKEVKKAG
jgi:hypothetical protein